MQTVLVTGANGFIGSYIIRFLQKTDYRVVATGKGEAKLPFRRGNVIYETLDFTIKNDVEKLCRVYQPRIIIHAGALSKPDECEADKELAYATNITATGYLLGQASVYKSFFIFLSTDFIFSGEKGMYREEDEARPVNYYGETKLAAEEEVKKYPNPWCIVRTVLVYGNPYGGRDNIVTSVAKALTRGQTLNMYDDQVRTPTYVEDLVRGIIEIIEREATGIYHISGNDVLTPYGIACAVADYIGVDQGRIGKVTRDTFPQGAPRPPKTGFDISKAARELDYSPISFKEGLSKTFEQQDN